MVKNKVFTNNMFTESKLINRLPLLSALLMLLVMTLSPPVFAKTSYVSDELKVPMRSGASNGHRIIKFVKSGTALTVIGASDDNKFVEVKISDDKSGWIAAGDLMEIPSGRDRLVYANKKLSKIKQDNKDLKKQLAELRSEIKGLKNEKGTLQNERTNLSNSLEDLKITAANPLSLSKKNKQLKKDLDKTQDSASVLEKENQKLRSNVAQEWFIIGGGVSIGSLIIGLILTRINWRRKKDSWGDSF